MHSGPKPFVLCADDYGLAPGIDRGILELLGAGRLSATSAIAVMPGWCAAAQHLRPFAGLADVGLHLVLTDHTPLGRMPALARAGRFPARRELEARARLRRLPLAEIADELERQFDAFERALGRTPAHVDGHHHVHQMPGIGALVADITRRRAPHAYVPTQHALLHSGAGSIRRHHLRQHYKHCVPISFVGER